MGLTAGGLVLSNGSDKVSVTGNGTFTFPAKVNQGAAYGVTVQTQPSGQFCSVTNGSGTLGASDVSNVQVLCTPVFTSLVTFGDSFSDVGSYAVGAVAAKGGGKFTINGNNSATNPALTGKTWTEVIADQLGLPAPCAAQTGLNGSAALGFSVPVVNHSACYNYAQSGARVSNAVGLGNVVNGSSVGALTVPVTTQIGNHLYKAGHFSGKELVLVMAGSEDALNWMNYLSASLIHLGTPAGTSAGDAYISAQLPNFNAAMAQAATDLVQQIRTQIIEGGANFVVVANVPDLGSTPGAAALAPSARAALNSMVAAFNQALSTALAGYSRVILVDVFAGSHDMVANPGAYGLTNVATAACDLSAARNITGSALTCNGANLISGDVSHYAFADTLHPTPYGHWLQARLVASAMLGQAWMQPMH